MARITMRLLGIFGALSTFSSFVCLASLSDNLIVHIQQGIYRGTHVNPDVTAFLGIPYAKPPVGDLRWEVAQKLNSTNRNTSSIIDATQFGQSCYQFRYHDIQVQNLSPRTSQSEDCLYLNVFVPTKGRSKNQLLPTFVWVSGGGFNEGDGSARAYDPSNLVASQGDIIVVTLNYRLSLFGFPNSPGLPIDGQNLGIRDMRAALEWLRDNVEAFGGDPSRIVLGGQSAGADAAVGLGYAFPDDFIANALFIESGDTVLIGEFDSSEFFAVAKSLGCRNPSNAKEELACMTHVPADKLQQAIIGNQTIHQYGLTGGMPMVDNLTVFTPEKYAKLGSEGKFARVPMFIGIMNQEGHGTVNWTPECGINKTIADVFTVTFFECPISAEASFRTKYSVPIWRYRYMGVFPADEYYPWAGSYHTADIPFLLGSYSDLIPEGPITSFEIEAANLFQDAVGTFVRDPKAGLLDKFGWPEYNASEKTLVELFRNNIPSYHLQDPSIYNSICANPPQLSIGEYFGPAPSCK